MSDLNVYSFTGRLGSDAELKFTRDGKPIWTASVGVGFGFGDNKGTNWIRVSVFGNRAESLGKLELQKGTAISVTGELRLRKYESNGKEGWSHEVVAQDVTLLGSKPEAAGGGGGSRGGAPRRQRPALATSPQNDFDDFADDDLPFASKFGRF